MAFDDKNMDVLQNIESMIVQAWRDNSAILDVDVMDALGALRRLYESHGPGRTAPDSRLSGPAKEVFNAVRPVCDMRIGRAGEGELPGPVEIAPIPVAELVECVRRIEKSVRRWNKEGGRRGYLEFIVQYVH